MATPAQTTSIQQNILYLFERPSEPFFVPKGDRKAVFDVPSNDFLVERFRPVADELGTRFGEDANVRIPVRNISFPDLSIPMRLGRRDSFSLFIPSHREMATRLLDIFLGMRTYEDFQAVAVYARDRVNPYLFVYALSVAILHRPDTKGLQLPPHNEIFPEKYMDGALFARAREESNVLTEGTREPLEIPLDYTATDLEPEHRVAYFREDLGINIHHWHWHLVFPFIGNREIVDKDRRGEIFYYMHQQIIARYNFERLCNRLGRVKRLLNLRDPIEEGYFPKLTSLIASRNWAARSSGAQLKDIDREVDQLKFDLQDLERWRDRIIEAIHMGSVINDKGQSVELTEMGGIDILGNIIESSPVLTINRNLYGDLHNLGHAAMGLCHDPDNRHLETFSTVGDPATSMRDPLFYRWHSFIDDLFQMHKRTLPSYNPAQLDYQGIRITQLEVNTSGAGKNEIVTFWQQNDVDMSRGMDFTPRGSVFARITRLAHNPFSFRIKVENNGNERRTGTVRIFLAPKFDERSQPVQFRDQRLLFIELDKFQVTLKNNPKVSTIVRESSKSSITIPFERTFRDLESRPTMQDDSQGFSYCGCGWPEHMLVPKGSPEGFPCQLFVMISNIADDRVEDTNLSTGACAESASFCGIRDKKFPDRRSMGYPFDRVPRTGVSTLQQFLTPNMAVADVRIVFQNRIEPPKAVSNTI